MNPDQSLTSRPETGVSKPLKFFGLRFNSKEQQIEIFGVDVPYLLDLNRDELLTRIADIPITEWHDFVDCVEFLIEDKTRSQNINPVETSGLPSPSRTSQNYMQILRSHNIPHLQSLLQRVLKMTENLDRQKLLPPIRPESIVGPNAPIVIEGTAKVVE